jgi:hypothetical protein
MNYKLYKSTKPNEKMNNLLKLLKLSFSSCIFILTFSFFRGIAKRGVASFFVNGATRLKMSIEVIQYPRTTALESNQYPLAKD